MVSMEDRMGGGDDISASTHPVRPAHRGPRRRGDRNDLLARPLRPEEQRGATAVHPEDVSTNPRRGRYAILVGQVNPATDLLALDPALQDLKDRVGCVEVAGLWVDRQDVQDRPARLTIRQRQRGLINRTMPGEPDRPGDPSDREIVERGDTDGEGDFTFTRLYWIRDSTPPAAFLGAACQRVRTTNHWHKTALNDGRHSGRCTEPAVRTRHGAP